MYSAKPQPPNDILNLLNVDHAYEVVIIAL